MRKLRPAHDAPEVVGENVISSGAELCRRARRHDFPRGVIIRVGGRVFFDETELLAFFSGGGGGPGEFAPRSTEAAEAEAGR